MDMKLNPSVNKTRPGLLVATDFGVYLGTKSYDYMKWDGPRVSAATARRHYLAGTAPDGATRARCLIGAAGLRAKDQKRIRLIPAKIQ